MTTQWVVAFLLFALLSWVALDLFAGILPWSLLDKSHPGRRQIGIALMVVIGAVGFAYLQDVLGYVWAGIQHVLLLDLESI